MNEQRRNRAQGVGLGFLAGYVEALARELGVAAGGRPERTLRLALLLELALLVASMACGIAAAPIREAGGQAAMAAGLLAAAGRTA